MAVAIVAGAVALTVLKAVGIGLLAGGGAGLAAWEIAEIAERIQEANKSKNAKSEWEKQQAAELQELQERLAKMQEEKRNDTYQGDMALKNALSVDAKRQEQAENYAADLKLIDALGLEMTQNGVQKKQVTTDTPTADIEQPNNPQENEEEKKQPIIIPPSGGDNSMIQDSTNNNIETSVGGLSAVDEWKKWAEEQQQKLWAREDELRRHVEAREDSAWQRSIEDARKAGVNVNLMNMQPAASGGGITSATQMNMSTITDQMEIDAEKIQQLIDQAFEGRENEKQQFMDIFGDLLQTIVFSMVMRKSGGSGQKKP